MFCRCSDTPLFIRYYLPPLTPCPDSEQLRDVFDKVDADGSGDLDCDEVLECLRGLGVNAAPSDVTRMFYKADANRDGVIDFSEFEKMYVTTYAKTDKQKVKKALEVSSDMKSTGWKDKKKEGNPLESMFKKIFDQ